MKQRNTTILKKSITPVVSVIILILITLGLASTTYLFLYNQLRESSIQTEKQIDIISDISALQIAYAYLYDYRNNLLVEFRLDEGSGLATYYKDIVGNFYDAGCGYKVSNYGTHYYEFYWYGCADLLEIIPNWKYTYQYCKNNSGYLVVISSDAENKFISSQVAWSFWIGYYQDPDDLSDNYGWPEGCPDNEPAGCWKWVDNLAGETSTFTNWYQNEPNNAGNIEQCATRVANTDKWNDIPCSYFVSWVCEYISEPEAKNINGLYSYPKWVDGVIGKAVKFDGVDDWITISNFSKYDPRQNITILSYVKSLEPVVQEPQGFTIVNRRAAYPTTPTGLRVGWRSWQLAMWPTSLMGCISTNENGVRCLYGSANFFDNKWHLVGMKYDGQKLVIFGDGKILNSVDWPGTIYYDYLYPEYNVDWRLFIGDFDGFASGGRKIIDEIRIYNESLSDEVIRDLYYRIHLIIYNPSSTPIELNNTYFSIGDCLFKLVYNRTFITDTGRSIIYPNDQIVLKVTNINCSLERNTEYDVCIIYKGKSVCKRIGSIK